jgi:hypothetical protein
VVDLRESTPQSTATQPSQQQQEQQQGFEPLTQQQSGPEAGAGHVTAGQQQQSGAAAADGAAAAAGAGVCGLVRGVSGGLSHLVKGPLTAIQQTVSHLLPGWGGAAGSSQQQQQEQQQQQQQPQEQQYQQQQYNSTQAEQQQQEQQPDQQPQDQQQLGTLPPDFSDIPGMGGASQYDLAAMQQYAQQSYQEQLQPGYDPNQQMYMEGWGMQPYDSSSYDPAAYSGDWMQQSQMYDGTYGAGGGAAAAAAAAAAPVGSGSKAVKGAGGPPKPRQTRCGQCKYCLNRHLKKGCEANRVREAVGRLCGCMLGSVGVGGVFECCACVMVGTGMWHNRTAWGCRSEQSRVCSSCWLLLLLA